MKRKVMMSMLLVFAFVVCTSASFANVFASDLSAPENITGFPVALQYRLNDNATTVTVEIFGPLPDTTVIKTINGGTARGLNTVYWDGTKNDSTPAPAGSYKFKVKAESTGYSTWTNITPKLYQFSLDWATSTGAYVYQLNPNISFNGNEFRDCCYHAASNKMVIVCNGASSSGPNRGIVVVDADTGQYVRQLSLTTVDAYDLDDDLDYSETSNWTAWLGPYAIKSDNTHNVFYMTPYASGNITGRFVGTDVPTSVSTWAVSPGFPSRANSVAGSGTNTLIYISNANSPNYISVFKTDTGTTFSLLEVTNIPGSHVVIAKPTNTGGDGDVIWAQNSTTAGGLKRYVRTGGTWVQDTNFVIGVTEAGFHHGDYVNIDGKDVLILPSCYHTIPKIYAVDGDTGAKLAEITVPIFGTPSNSATAGVEVYQATPGSSACKVYFGLGTNHVYGRLTFGFGEIGSAQYYAAQGIESIQDQNSPYFGHLLVGSGDPRKSSNPGAEAEKIGMYMLNADMTWTGGTVSSAYAACKNDPTAPWNPNDNYTIWKIHAGTDDGIIYMGNWGTLGLDSIVWRYDLVNTATPLLALSSSVSATGTIPTANNNHGRVISVVSKGTGSSTELYGIDRDLIYQSGDNASYYRIWKWDIGTTTTNYIGLPALFLQAPNTGVGVTDAYSHRDIDIDKAGTMYIANRRWSNSQVHVYAVNLNPKSLKWSKTGAALGQASGWYPSGVAVDEPRGLVYILGDAYVAGQPYPGVVPLNMSDGSKAGDVLDYSDSTSTSGGRAIAVDAAGNVYTSHVSDEHVRQWSPPGPNSFTTTYYGQMNVPGTNVEDWMVF